jgi:CHAT domain-containing protein
MRASFLLMFIFQGVFSIAQTSQIEKGDSSLYFIFEGGDFFAAGDYIRAEGSFTRAFEIRQKLYTPDNILIAHTCNNLGVVAMKIWSYETALEKLHKAEMIYLKNPLAQIDLGTVYGNIGYLYSLMGDFLIAEQYYNKALDILITIKEAESFQMLAELYNNYGILEYQKKNYSKSSKFLKFAIEKYGKIIKPVTLHNLYKNISNAYLSDNKFSDALYYYNKSLSLARSSNQLPLYYEASSYFGLAKFYIKTKNKSEAYNYLEKTRGIYNKIEIDSAFLYNLDLDYALYYETFDLYPKSNEYYQKALGYLTRQNLNNSFATPNSNKFIEKIKGISLLKYESTMLVNWYHKSDNTDLLVSALETLKVASELIDNARNGYLTYESKLSIAENEASIYKLGIWCAHQLYQKTHNTKYLESAFYFAEKSKSSVLEASLQEEKAKSFAGIPDSLVDKEQKLKRDITFYKNQIYEEQRMAHPDNSKITIWDNYLFDFTRQQEDLKNLLEKNYSDYYKLKYQNTTITIGDVQRNIDKKSTVLEYSITDSVLYIFRLTSKSTDLYAVDIDSNFYTIVSDFLNQFRQFSFVSQGKSTFEAYVSYSQKLFDYILKPALNSQGMEDLVIIPDDILSYLPFEAIVCPTDKNEFDSYRDMNYLILNHTISYSYSASLMVETSGQESRKLFNRLIAFAPTYSSISDTGSIVMPTVRSNYRDKLYPIPYALEEAKMVCKITRGESYTEKEATVPAFMKLAPEYNIIHLAMHTIIDDNNPLYSKLVFYADSSGVDDGLLTTSEIFGLKLNAGLTVLSSCSSGDGKFGRGEGVLSLARGVFYAGCPSLVMTLWKVEDASGLTLMKYFYKYLLKGYSKPRALQLAKIEYLKSVPEEKQHPFYWSAYICIGNTQPMYYSRWIMVVLVILAMFIIRIVFKRSRSRLRSGKGSFRLKEPAL